MNRKMVFFTIGRIVGLEAVLMLLPLGIALLYREDMIAAFLLPIAIAAGIGGGLMFFCKPKNRTIYARDGFVIVALAWIFVSLIGAIPFSLGGAVPTYVDALFETVSGFTTTGASVISNIEEVTSHSLLFWRSFTHWIGGMGVLVLMMALLPSDSGRFIHIMRAEMPGPAVDKMLPRLRDTAKILYLIYIVMTFIMIIFLRVGGMSVFESVIHAMGTAGTGGFGLKADSVGGYSPYLQWVIAIFMLLFSLNFNLYYFILLRRFKEAFTNSELWWYFLVVGLSITVIACNIYPLYQNLPDTVRHAFFQGISISSTSGFATVDFNQWPGLSKGILLMLMFMGGCVGSTAGGLKMARVMLLLKTIRRDLKRALRPRVVGVVTLDGRRVDAASLSGMNTYFSLYMVILAVVFLLLCLEPFDFETNLTAVITCFNNVGPGFGGVGPAASFAEYSGWAKILLSFTMLFGRLEIYPMLFTLSLTTWTKK